MDWRLFELLNTIKNGVGTVVALNEQMFCCQPLKPWWHGMQWVGAWTSLFAGNILEAIFYHKLAFNFQATVGWNRNNICFSANWKSVLDLMSLAYLYASSMNVRGSYLFAKGLQKGWTLIQQTLVWAFKNILLNLQRNDWSLWTSFWLVLEWLWVCSCSSYCGCSTNTYPSSFPTS